jgi:hypothetical protein
MMPHAILKAHPAMCDRTIPQPLLRQLALIFQALLGVLLAAIAERSTLRLTRPVRNRTATRSACGKNPCLSPPHGNEVSSKKMNRIG